MVSLNLCRSYINQEELSGEDFVVAVEDYYDQWVAEPFYVVVFGWLESQKETRYGAFRSAKRGDAKYSRRVGERFNMLEATVGESGVYWFGWNEVDRTEISSPLVFVTLTYERSFDLRYCWENVGKDFNRYVSALRRLYGKINIVRAFESHVDGYPHIHAVFAFEDVVWRGFRHINDKGELSFRVDAVEEFKHGWAGGFVDCQLCHSIKSAFYYVEKYVVKASDKSQVSTGGHRTLALSWFFHKRAFSVSGDFRKAYSDSIKSSFLLAISNRSFAYFKRFDGTILHDEVTKWHLYGVVKCHIEGWGDSWVDVPLSLIHELIETDKLELRLPHHYINVK